MNRFSALNYLAMNKFFVILSLLILTTIIVAAQTQKDTIYTYYSKAPVVIDGSDADACWSKADWHPIEQVWLGNAMTDGDFAGKFKVAWDKNYLYVLVEVIDDSLSDDHKNPTDNYWNDDCVEIFIDEDRSGGIHQNNNSAFAYHCSIFYDVIDGAGTNGATINCRNNITMVMDTIKEKTYRWEFAVKMFNKNFTYSNPDPSRVYLTPNKLLGFSIAYCDNDETMERENFIGSVVMPKGHENDSYINSDYFGSMLLIDPENQWLSKKNIYEAKELFSVFPRIINDQITISLKNTQNRSYTVEIISASGEVVKTFLFNGQQKTVDLSNLTNGMYFVRILSADFSQTEKFIKL
jgi:hypothetical protein